MVPIALIGKAVNEGKGIGITEFGGAEKHDLRFVYLDGVDTIGKIRVLTTNDRSSRSHKETLRVIIFVRESRIVAQTISVIEK